MIKIKDLDKLKNLTKNELNVLLELLDICDSDNNVFFHDNGRDYISENLDISRNSLVKSLLSLEKNRGLLNKRNDFYYVLDRDVFASS